MWHWMQGGGLGMGSGAGMIMTMAFWLLVLAAVVWFVRFASDRPFRQAGPNTPATPLEILQRRYASGDVGRDEYDQKRRDLTGPSTRDDNGGSLLREDESKGRE